MSDSNKIQRSRPSPGIVDNLDVLQKAGIGFRSIIGSVTSLDNRPGKEIPCTPGLGLYYWHIKHNGPEDTQKPHFQDEVYVILDGKGKFHLESESEPIGVNPGDVIFVPALMEHHFITDGEDIRMLIFFGPDWCGRDASEEQEKID